MAITYTSEDLIGYYSQDIIDKYGEEYILSNILDETYFTFSDYTNEDTGSIGISITGLTYIGKTASVIIVPPHLTLSGESKSVINIENPVFGNVSDDFECNASTIILPNTIEKLNAAFYSTNAETVEIGHLNKITIIDSGTFCSAYNLTVIDIPYNVTTIGDEAFMNCRSLVEVHRIEIDGQNMLCRIGEYAFAECSSLSSFDFSGIGDFGVGCFGSCGFESVEIPEGMETIPSNMFYHCESLENIKLPSTITTIEHQAFCGCNLSSIDTETGLVGLNLEYIGVQAFYGNPNLEFINFGNTPEIGEGVVDNCTSLKSMVIYSDVDLSSWETQIIGVHEDFVIYCKKDSTTHDYAERVGHNYKFINHKYNNDQFTYEIQTAFYSGSDIGISITGLSDSGKENLSSNSELIVPESIDGLEVCDVSNLFYYLDGEEDESRNFVESVVFPNTVSSIYDSCNDLPNLTYVKLPENTIYINESFANCPSLREVTIYSGNNSRSFIQSSFCNCDNLSNVKITDGDLKWIDGSFYKCPSLISVEIPNSVTDISSSFSEVSENFTIKCYSESYAEKYAIENNIKYEFIGGEDMLPSFTATARIPVRPLNYNNKDAAKKKELLADYKEGKLFISKEDGEIVEISSDVSAETIKAVLTSIQQSEDAELIITDKDISVSTKDLNGEETVVPLSDELAAIRSLLGIVNDFVEAVDGDKNFVIDLEHLPKLDQDHLPDNINGDKINFDDASVPKTDKQIYWDSKTNVQMFYVEIPAFTPGDCSTTDDGNYIYTINIDDMVNAPAIVDLNTQYANNYDNYEVECKEYAKMYRLCTNDGTINIYTTDVFENTVHLSIALMHSIPFNEDQD